MIKIISLFTLVTFMVFSLSCSFIKNVSQDTAAVKGNGKIKIVQVAKKSGEIIEFSKGQPGRIYNGIITGTAVRVSKKMEIERANVETATISQSQYSQELEKILGECAEYCNRLSGVVLDFVCTEKITETIYRGGNVVLPMTERQKKYINKYENKYEYDYQLIRKDRKITEQRILMKENSKDKDIKNAALKTRFLHEYMVLGPYSLLSDEWQPYHDYKIVDEKKMWGKKTYIIEAVPKPGFTMDHSWGRIWICKEDFCIFKIEWDQKSIKDIESLPENMRINVATEYKIEKSGIRFPSLYKLEETYTTPGAKRLLRSEIKVEYKDYKFFTVETEVKYED